jgi:NAD(P)H-hydrate epimerase
VPYITGDEMRKVDRAMVGDYRIEIIQMMENAGRVLAALTRRRFLDDAPVGRSVLVLCGPGNNGGGGLVAARRLHGWGADVRVITTRPAELFLGIPEHQLDIVERLGVPVTHAGQPTVLGDYDVVLDAILGFGLVGAPRDGAAQLIRLANELGAPILSLDTPSGLDVTTGQPADPTVTATATLTLGLPKIGFQRGGARPVVGELYLGDIGVPPELYAGSGLAYDVGPLFAQDEILRL